MTLTPLTSESLLYQIVMTSYKIQAFDSKNKFLMVIWLPINSTHLKNRIPNYHLDLLKKTQWILDSSRPHKLNTHGPFDSANIKNIQSKASWLIVKSKHITLQHANANCSKNIYFTAGES